MALKRKQVMFSQSSALLLLLKSAVCYSSAILVLLVEISFYKLCNS